MDRQILKLLSKRLFHSAIVLILLILFVFILVRVSPGDPVQKYISPQLSPQLAGQVRESFGLDKPLHQQMINFITNILQGDLGISYKYRQPVWSVIWNYLPFTLIFSTISFIIQIIFSLLLALISVKKVNGLIDRSINKFSMILFAIPSFVSGIFLIYIFSEQLKLFPSSGLASIGTDNLSFFPRLFDYSRHLILPLITLSIGGIAVFYKYIRDNLESVLNSNFVLYLRANGFSKNQIIWKHVIPNAINPLISVAGIELGILLSGTLITEVIFSLPGMGRLTINSIFSRDYPLIIGCTLTAGVLIMLSNLIADIIKVKIDKRMLQEITS